MLATKAALASGGMTHFFCRWGLRVFFLASAQSCCRWHGQRSSVPRPAPQEVATSTACDPLAVWSRPKQSVWLPPPHQRSAASPRLVNACASGRPRTPLPPVAGGSGLPYRRWYPRRLRFGCRPILRPPPRRRPSTEYEPWEQPRGMFAHMDQRVEPPALLVAELH